MALLNDDDICPICGLAKKKAYVRVGDDLQPHDGKFCFLTAISEEDVYAFLEGHASSVPEPDYILEAPDALQRSEQ